MKRHSDTDAARQAREAELWRRVRALDDHVLGRPGARRTASLRVVVWLGLALGLVLLFVLLTGPGADNPTGEVPG